MKPQKHPQEEDRLATLTAYGVLDSARDPEFDEIVDLAAAICETPVAIVNLIDSDRGWFKAETGMSVPEVPRDHAFCSHAILEDGVVEIPDTRQDARTADNPLTIDGSPVRFYAGAPLVAPNGLPLGSLCVLDTRPRRLTDLQLRTLRALAQLGMQQMELRLRLEREKVLRQEVDHRVKNSLQSVVALTRIQGRRAESEETRAALAQVRGRIEVITALHEQLYRTDAGDRIDLSEFAGNVARFLSGFRPENVSISLDVPRMFVTSSQASAIGVIVNECAANAFRHGFPDGRAGRVTITARPDGDGMVLVCEDDGIGLSDNGTKSATGGLGMQVISASADQLGGPHRVENGDPGVRIIVPFTPVP
ncbi:Two-component sensor histidine kinase, contains HisKA and HATPase domains [Tranquillimonas rosea]|uniref:Two-component sensor histidine kinase, contains HisKA and HATPase domains n=1 Tax=Tranquillimonas rosea TaxID=641238 RepID=A0A1H9TLH8_9RHOB|nr:histidine kinase dimerization/phosphoacceptor domain -containing protein [Tranquillimonas rosea]SER97982.1 Two-component sensor histidine kinase, contains HisKA and HATPase domains [Tranquillimonas rosea]